MRRRRSYFRGRRSGTFFQWNGCKCLNCSGDLLRGFSWIL